MRVKDDRSFWIYFLLSFVTCGIYGIYFWYKYVDDLNTVFYGDGQDSQNYIIVWLLSLITCGIYGVYWYYRQANRIYHNSYSWYGVQVNESGTTILLWFILGYLAGGIGQLVGQYFMITNFNRVASVYNQQQSNYQYSGYDTCHNDYNNRY